MFFSIITCAMGLALTGVHSIPAPSESFSVSEMANLARALPSGDTYPPQPPGGGPGKCGLLYNSGTKAGWSDFFVGSSRVTYGSNGDVVRGNELNARFSYVPTIKVNGALENSEWNDLVPILIEGGTKALLASNEPDNPSQANLSPSQAVTVYKKYMQPYYGTVQLGTPAVTNGGGSKGLAYLDKFLGLCTGCAYNFVNVHFFASRSSMNVGQYIQALKDYVDISVPAIQKKHAATNGLPIAIGAFWLTGVSASEAADLLNELLPWLDENSNILFYQASGGLFEGQFVNAAGTGLTAAGTAYKNVAP